MHPATSCRKRLIVVAIAALASVATAAARADEYFMRLSGGTPGIFGESVTKGYENWIELDSVAWGVTANTSWTQGGGASVGKPNPGDLMWSQSFDSSVPAMYSYLLSGKAVQLATVEYVHQGDSGPVTYLQLAMSGLFFTGLAFNGGDVSGSAVFKTITMTYWPLASDGTREKPIQVSWDIPAGTVGNTGSLPGVVAGYGGGDLSPSPVPEPGTYALMLAGLLIIGVVARRRSVH